MAFKTVAITVRFPPSILKSLDDARGSEPTANFIRRVVIEKLNDGQKSDAVLHAIAAAKTEILQTLLKLAS